MIKSSFFYRYIVQTQPSLYVQFAKNQKNGSKTVFAVDFYLHTRYNEHEKYHFRRHSL